MVRPVSDYRPLPDCRKRLFVHPKSELLPAKGIIVNLIHGLSSGDLRNLNILFARLGHAIRAKHSIYAKLQEIFPALLGEYYRMRQPALYTVYDDFSCDGIPIHVLQ
jgi:hypothetical protein